VIDSHVHVVSSDEVAYPRQTTPETASHHASPTVDAEALLALASQEDLDKIVLVQSFAAYGFDNRYTADVAKRRPERFGFVCGVDPAAADAAEASQYWVDEGANGLRVLAFAPDFDVDVLRPIFEVAASSGVAVCLLATPHVLDQLAGALSDAPGLTLVLDHCGLGALDSGKGDLGAPQLLALADCANAHLKISTRVFDHVVGDPRGVVEVLVDRFGAERIMWGSDFPASPAPSYAGTLEQALKMTSGLRASAREAILHGTSERVWRLGSGD
jgi:L-fuconolactonase